MPPAVGAASSELSVGGAFSSGWMIFTQNYGSLLAVTLIYVAIEIGFIIAGLVCEAMIGFNLIVFAKAIFFEPPMMAGVSYFAVQLARGHKPPIGDMFVGFSRYWALIGVGILVALIAITVLFVAGLGAGIVAVILFAAGPIAGVLGVVTAVAFVLFVMLAVTARLWFASLICLDPHTGQPGVTESIAASWRATSGSAWGRILVIFILFMLIYVASILALVLPVLFFAMPLISAVIGATYVAIAPRTGLIQGGRRCAFCGYDLYGVPSPICPECGNRWEYE
ncbi:MAG: hypothetical protein IIB55_06015 [Planctomycetes bacterium]|nr:hypothetical protein [Planctomycetota bacterium]